MPEANIEDVLSVLKRKLQIPPYQRPYTWHKKSVVDLLDDIDTAIESSKTHADFKYRIGSVILHKTEKGEFDVVDGQQRLTTLLLIMLHLDEKFSCKLKEHKVVLEREKHKIHENFVVIKDWFHSKNKEYREKFKAAFEDILQVVVITVDKLPEAFQLFDSQNTRGKALDPHDLLKAYHLRYMTNNKRKMQKAVTAWEAKKTVDIRELFDKRLYPIKWWAKGKKSKKFTVHEIDAYKGIEIDKNYGYASRAQKASPEFQLNQAIISGGDFFKMVAHYLDLQNDIDDEIENNKDFAGIRDILDKKGYASAGFGYAKQLFYCAVLSYYDKFSNFDVRAIKKLFTGAFMLRVDMQSLGFDSVNKYAIGDSNGQYSNSIAMFYEIENAREHKEIANEVIKINVDSAKRKKLAKNWAELADELEKLNGGGKQ